MAGLLPHGRHSTLKNLAATLVALGIILSGCALKLAPAYDASIVSGLEVANEEAMTLFASVSAGTSSATFAERAAKYTSLIGKLEALRVTAQARPAPSIDIPGILPGKDIEPMESPTPDVLASAVKPIELMRDTDQAGQLTSTIVVGIKNSFELQIAQALVYEKALQR